MQPALHEDLRASGRHRLADFFQHFFMRQHIPFGMPGTSEKSAKAALAGANIRIVNVAVHNKGYRIIRKPLAPGQSSSSS